ncbi:MARVEL domain-containing protein 2b [Enoplosus armatus]|uniref:MARVEL domain-containing protein 2b n=1 Tax=Enoplosus armatus TaxID=215367 RepID=UPI003994E2AC
MSSGGAGSVTRFDWVRNIPHYDQVPVGSLWRDPDVPPPPAPLHGTVPAGSLDPLPPPPLPEQPAVGLESFCPLSDDEPVEGDCDAMDIKPVHRFIPDSVKNFFRGNSGNRGSKGWSIPPPPPPPPAPHSPGPWSRNSDYCSTTAGVPCSPPHSTPPSPSLPGSYRDPYGGSGGSYTSQKERDGLLLGADAFDSTSAVPTNLSALTYHERVEEYHQRYAYMKSWAGLLRILGCVELLLGAAVFACVCAYVHKDNEWFNMYGYSQPQMFGGLGGGAGAYGYGGGYYTGPKTPFVLVVAGLAWIVTVILVVLGMSLYYRAILLDSSWWPLTECCINLVLAVLYLAAGIVYVRDTTRGGLCNMPVFNNGVNGAFCRTEAGQTAAIVFLFITMVLYFISAGVCLKLWRHEAARLRKEGLAQEMKTIGSSVPLSILGPSSRASERTPLPTIQPDIMDAANNSAAAPLMALEPEILRGHIPAGHIPKPVVIADYVAKYPSIRSEEERDQYKAVFNDQYAEYKELHAEVQAMAKKFEEMDEMMQNLPPQPSSQMEKERISGILMEYQKKKADPTYLEKRDRCEYLKNKLSHIKQKIQEYNKVTDWNDDLLPEARARRVRPRASPVWWWCWCCVRVLFAFFITSAPPRDRTLHRTRAEFQLHFNMPNKKHSPPPYQPNSSKHHSSRHRHSELMSNPAFSYYPGEKMLHFYRWTSPPGVMKILCIIIIIMCVAVFACVASTLAWDYDGSSYGGSYGSGSYGSGYGGGYGGSYGGGSGIGGSYGYGGAQMDPKAGKGFIIAIAAITFIAVLIIFVLVVSRQNAARSSKFYLAAIIICAILAFLMIIATIVYLVAVNPTAQSTGSVYYSQIRQLCAQYQTQTQAQGIFLNQYLYHYCVVEPQEAIAIVLGFLVFIALIILLVFAVKTRSKIRRWGRDRVLWEEVKVINDGLHNSVGEWVNNVSGDPEVQLNDHNPKIGGSRDYLDRLDHIKPLYLPGDSDISSSVGGVKPRLRDYDTGVESGDDLEEEDFSVLFPSIVDEQERLTYKLEFDRDHQEYKSLQAELDSMNQDLADLDRELNRHTEGSPQFLDAMDEYARLKSLKKSPSYEIKKKRCKYLRSKLSHIKRKISEYDRRP